MPINWPPVAAPSWPPPEMETSWLSFSGVKSLVSMLLYYNFTQAAPTGEEDTLYFDGVRCDHEHNVIGRMIVSPDGLVRYPFAVCNNSGHRDFLVLWDPYYTGYMSGLE